MGESAERWIPQHSAGGVVVKREASRTYVLLIKPHNRNRWQLPKGTIDPGESPDVTAIREVREEGGVDARIMADLGPITFFYQMSGRKFVKTVDFFLMEYVSGSPANHDHEVDDSRWFPIEQAVKTVAFKTEQDLVARGLAWLRQHPSALAS